VAVRRRAIQKGASAMRVERIELYDRLVSRTIAQLRLKLGERALDRALWAEIRTEFAALIDGLPDAEFTKTFFSSITRQLYGTVRVAPEIEFVATDLDPPGQDQHHRWANSYLNHGSLASLVRGCAGRCPLSLGLARLRAGALAHVTSEVTNHLRQINERRTVIKVEIFAGFSTRWARAYIVDAVLDRDFLGRSLRLKNTDGGVLANARDSSRTARGCMHRATGKKTGRMISTLMTVRRSLICLRWLVTSDVTCATLLSKSRQAE